jgi:hypothetical protein
MIRTLMAWLLPRVGDHGGSYCPQCGWWTRPACGHTD